MREIAYENRWYDKVKRFNKCFPSGTLVSYTTKTGIRCSTEVEYPAVILSSGIPVIWLKDIQGYCSFTNVVVI